jgi:hypothetical protein
VKAVKWTGWFMAVCGTVFIAAAAVLHGNGLGVILGLGIPGLIGLLAGAAMIAADRGSEARASILNEVAANGLAGTATITDVTQTGVWINDNPQCRISVNVSLPDRLIYQATVTEVIPQIAVARYAPGATFPCRVSPGDLGLVVLIDDTGVARGSSAAILSNGVPGMATVLGIFNPPPARRNRHTALGPGAADRDQRRAAAL